MTSEETIRAYIRRQRRDRRIILLFVAVALGAFDGAAIYEIGWNDSTQTVAVLFGVVLVVCYVIVALVQALGRMFFSWSLVPLNVSDMADIARQRRGEELDREPPPRPAPHPPGDPAYWGRPIPEDFYAAPSHRPPRLVARREERLLPPAKR